MALFVKAKPMRLTLLLPTAWLLALAASVNCVAHAEAPRTIDLFIFAGQSNMVGADADPAQLPDSSSDQRVLFWWSVGDPPADKHDSTSSGHWKTLQVQPRGNPMPRNGKTRQWGNFTSKRGGFGPEIGFARRRLSQLDESTKTNESEFAILKVAYSGTTVENDWNPDQASEPGNCYGELLRQFKASTSAAAKRSIVLRPAGFFWVQGESDSNEERRVRYGDRLKSMLSQVRSDFDAAELPVFLAVNTRFQEGRNEGMKVVIETQRQIAEADPHCQYIDTSAATIANAAHYDAKGTLLVGRLFAEAMSSLAIVSY